MFAQRGFEPIRELKASAKLKKQTEKLVELCFRKNHSLDIDALEFNSKVEKFVFKKLGKLAYKHAKEFIYENESDLYHITGTK